MGTNGSHDQRLDHLLRTAAKVFADKGFHSTSMRNLAEQSGMSLAGMYHYVSGKEQLLFLIQERCFGQVLEGAHEALIHVTDPAERLTRFIEHHVTFFASHMAEMKVLSHEAASLGDESVLGIQRLKRRYVDMLLALVEGLDPAKGRGIEPAVAVYALFGMMNWIYNWYDPSGAASPAVLARSFSRLFLYGLTNETPTPVPRGG